MDIIDRSILKLLQEDARMANSDIAKKLDIAASVIWDRIKKMEERGVIKKYRAVVNPEAIGLNILAFSTIVVNSTNWSNKCSKHLEEIENIEELHEVVGESSYLAKIRVKDMNELSEILKNKIAIIPEVELTKTVIAVNSVKENPHPNLNEIKE